MHNLTETKRIKNKNSFKIFYYVEYSYREDLLIVTGPIRTFETFYLQELIMAQRIISIDYIHSSLRIN